MPRAAAVLPAGPAAAPHTAAERPADRSRARQARAVLPAHTLAPGPVLGTAVAAGSFDGRRAGAPDDDQTGRVRLPRPTAGRR